MRLSSIIRSWSWQPKTYALSQYPFPTNTLEVNISPSSSKLWRLSIQGFVFKACFRPILSIPPLISLSFTFVEIFFPLGISRSETWMVDWHWPGWSFFLVIISFHSLGWVSGTFHENKSDPQKIAVKEGRHSFLLV